MSLEVSTNTRTLADVLNFMAPFAGGSVPDEDDQEYLDWVRWIQNKQEEYARRAFWRRCLTRETISIAPGFTKILPDRFNRPNALFMLIVTDANGKSVDWNEHDNSDDQTIFVEMNNDYDDANFGKWQMRFNNEVLETTSAILWYFANPPKPTESSDVVLLPGDMIGYAALAEYYRQANQEGSQDKAEEDAENRFTEYLSIETLPNKSELMVNSENGGPVNRLAIARNRYRTRAYRNTQG